MSEDTVGDCLRCGQPVSRKDLIKIKRSTGEVESPYHSFCGSERMWDLFEACVTEVMQTPKPEVPE